MRKPMKILTRSLATIVVLLLLLVVGVKLFFPLEKAKQLVVAKAQERLDRPVAVGEVDVSLAGGLGIKLMAVEVGNPPAMTGAPLLTAAAVDLKLSFWPLLKGEIQAHRLIINEPRLELVQLPDGTNNFTFPGQDGVAASQASSDGKPAEGLVVSFDQISVRNGQVGFTDQTNDQGARLFGLDLAASLDSPGPNRFHAVGKLALDSLQVQGPQRLPVLPLDLEFDADYDLDLRQLTIGAAEIALSSITLNLTGELNHGEGALQAAGKISAADIPLVDILNLLPSDQRAAFADFDLDGKVGCQLDLTFAQADTGNLDYAGAITLADLHFKHRPTPGELTASLVKADVRPDRVAFTTENGAFDGQPLRAQFVVEDFADPRIEGQLGGDVDLSLVQPFLPADLEAELAGPASFSLQANGRLNNLTDLDFSGRLDVAEARLLVSPLTEPLTDLELALQVDRQTLRIEQCRGRLGTSEFSCTGSITDLLDAALADSSGLRLDLAGCEATVTADLDLALFQPFLPEEKQAELAGRITADLQLQGPLDAGMDLIRSGRVEIKQLRYTDRDLFEPLQELDAGLQLAPDLITLDHCNVRFPSSDFALAGTVRNAFPYFLPATSVEDEAVPRPIVAFSLRSDRLDLDRMFPQAKPADADPGSGPGVTPPDTLKVTGMPDITGAGTVQVDTLVFNRVEFTAITCQAKLENRHIVCTDITGRMYQGQATGEATFGLQNLARPTYAGSFQATQIEADDFLSRFTPFGGLFFGKFDLQGEFGAAGREAATVRNTLTMDGQAKMRDGKVVTSGFAFTALSNLAGKLGQDLSKEQGLRDLATLIKVQDGKVSLDQITTRLGQLGDLSLAGHYSFAGGIHYQGTLLLTPEQSQKLLSGGGLLGGLAGLLGSDKDERVALPLTLDGTLAKPQFKVDYAALAARAGQNLSQEAENKLKDLFK